VKAPSGSQDRAPGLLNRAAERGALDQFVAGVRAGQGQSLVVRGEPGVGKTVLLDYLAGPAALGQDRHQGWIPNAPR
jgi:ABC-type transport system involved in cytochrome c biogenesis ATPase subunit